MTNRAMFSVFCLFLFATNCFSERMPPMLGIIIPVTGPAALTGQSIEGVVQLTGFQVLKVHLEDDFCDSKKALSAYFKLRKEGVRVFYVGCSNSLLALQPHAKRNGDLLLATYAGSGRIRDSGTEIIRLNPDAHSMVQPLVDLVDASSRPVALMYEEQEYASSLAEGVAERLGDEVVSRVAYRSDGASFVPEIMQLKRSSAKSLIFIPVADGPARQILKELAQQGVQLKIFGEVNLCDYPFKPLDYGFHGKCISAHFSGARADKFRSDYERVVGREPAFPFFDAITYDLFLKLEAISAKGSESFKVPLVKKEILDGFSGEFADYQFTKNGEIAEVGDYLSIITY